MYAENNALQIGCIRSYLKTLNIKGHAVVADTLNCQKEKAKIIVEQKADYLLCVKDDHPVLKKDIEDYIQDELLQNTIDIITKTEKNYGRIEIRTAYVPSQIKWLEQRKEWKNLCCIGAIHTEFDTKKASQANGIIIFKAEN